MKSKSQKMKEHILDCALILANSVGYQNLRRDELARVAGVGQGTINLHFSTMVQLKRAVMRAAIRYGEHRIVAQGLSISDPQALAADDHVKRNAAAYGLSS
jgi:AcrR family transcriptional regulator